ncbi:MAG TPA: hypothetical protein VMH24_01930 [Candidatus Sulfotelmatobacter sp.]|nr:hypothetical protein [Candidatus Sulfotelmatobacter sp.]
MKVSSPVGEFPFEPTRLEVRDSGLVVHGLMGAWPATVRVEPADIPAVVRLIPPPALAVLAFLAGLIGWRLVRR